MKDSELFCPKCEIYVKKPKIDWTCPHCGYPLITKNMMTKKSLDMLSDPFDISTHGRKVTLGEGNTPLIKTGVNDITVYFKLEHLNPTGSFKDRGTVTVISHFLNEKKSGVVVDSSGNTAISVAAYSSLIETKSFIVVPRNAPEGKINLIKSLGGNIVLTNTREEAFSRALEIAKQMDFYYVSHPTNPFFIEGEMSIFIEIVREMGCPDNIILPVSSGTLLLGIYYSLINLDNNSCHNTSIWGVQPTSNATLIDQAKNKILESGKAELTDALRVKNPPRKKEMIDAINKTNGGIILVNDKDVKEGLKKLLKKGLIIEPSSAVVLPALFKAIKNGYIEKNEKNLLILTGSGLKYVMRLKKLMED